VAILPKDGGTDPEYLQTGDKTIAAELLGRKGWEHASADESLIAIGRQSSSCPLGGGRAVELEVGFGVAALRHPLAAGTAGLLPAYCGRSGGNWLPVLVDGRFLGSRFIGFGFTQDVGLTLEWRGDARESLSELQFLYH